MAYPPPPSSNKNPGWSAAGGDEPRPAGSARALVADRADAFDHLLLESLADHALIALDPEGRIVTWTAPAERITGYTRDEAIGQHVSMFYTPDEVAAGTPAAELEAAARTGRSEHTGWRVRKDGTRFIAGVVTSPVRDASGALVGFARLASDITQKQVADEALRESEERFRLLVQSVQDYGIFMLDAQGNVATWNEGAERIKGWSASEIIGRHFSTFYPPEDNAWGKPAWELEVAAREGRFEDEGWRLRKDGTRFWANVVITALFNARGVLIGFAKVTRDLTERKGAEEALRESEERFRLLVQNVQDYGIFMLDPEGNVASWNEGAERIKGYTAGEIIGRHFSTFYPPEDNAWGKPAWELEVATREGRFEDEGGWRVRKDGTRFWANVVITALRDPKGKLIGFTKVTRDLTERRAATERAIADARRVAEAEAANRAKTEFLTAMSHELRTPLNAIGGYTDLLVMGIRGPVNEEQVRDLERIRSSQQHLLGIINDLLNYSRIEAGRLAYDFTRVPVGEAIDAVVPMVEPQAVDKGLRLHRGPCPPGAVAHADRMKLEQILLNLFSNAVKFTPPGGTIEVFCGEDGGTVSVSVRDTGTGVPAEKLEAIFEPFVQLGRTLATSREGTGLGLAISRDLARAMGGDLVATSADGEGSTFTLTLRRAT